MELIKFLPQFDPGLGPYFLPEQRELPDWIYQTDADGNLVPDPDADLTLAGIPGLEFTRYKRLYGALRIMTYTFQQVQQLAMVEMSLDFHFDYLIWALTGISSDSNGFRVSIDHTHPVVDPKNPTKKIGKRTSLLNKHAVNQNILGVATNPLLVKSPYLVKAGDSVMVEVRNLAPAANPVTTIIQVCLHGTEYSPEVKQT